MTRKTAFRCREENIDWWLAFPMMKGIKKPNVYSYPSVIWFLFRIIARMHRYGAPPLESNPLETK